MEKKRQAKSKREDIEKALIENYVNLQKVLTNLAVKFDSLSDQISKLLQLFEISAKTFVEKQTPELGGKKTDKEFLEKLDKLLDQNKIIAKGLTLMEEKLKERLYGPGLEVSGVTGTSGVVGFSGPSGASGPRLAEPRKTENERPRYPRPAL